MTGELQLFVLGKPRLQRDGQPLTGLVSAKAQALLFYLAVTGQPCSRSALAGLLWGDLPEEAARANLRLTLSKLRKYVPDHLSVEWQTVAFDVTQPHRLDVNDFLARALKPAQQSAAEVRAALELYQGEFLEDFSVREAPEFETWALAERERLHQTALRAWQQLVTVAAADGDYALGIEAARQTLALEPWHEETHQQLMTLLAANGQRSAALAQFELCRRVLAEELAVEPSTETEALWQKIKAGQPERAAPVEKPGAAQSPTAARPLPNLPPQLTPLIGREAERAQIAERLAHPDCRLLTLLGPGGIGKTRLALAVAETQEPLFREGAVFVPLASVTAPQPEEAVDALVAAIAAALHYTFVAQQPPREGLLNYLAPQSLLLVLDNVEQLRPTGRWLEDVLRRAPGVKLLVTSRERLGITSEWLFEVQGLPCASTLTSYASAIYPAVQLFAECARRLRPAFDLAAEAAAVNRLCQLVEGSPLGIELAAQWVPVLSCAEIVARLENSLDLLSETSPGAGRPDERHQSMRAVLTDSWRALTEAERQVFCRLSIFQGGFGLAAAEPVAGAALPLLASLSDKSWLRRNEAGRYQVHELLRQFGAEQLALQPSLSAATQQAHGHYYLDFVSARAAALEAGVNDEALAELDPEWHNLRAAREWWLAQADVPAIATYLEGLWHYYRRQGWWQEAVLAFERALQLPAATNVQRGLWRRRLGEANYQMGRIAASEEHLLKALALLGEPPPISDSGWGPKLLGQVARQGLHHLWPNRFVGREAHDRERLLNAAEALHKLGPISYQAGEGLPSLTIAVWDLNLAERTGSASDMARACAGCGITLGSLPLHALAQSYGARAITLARSTGQPLVLAYCLELAALYRLGLGRWREAEPMLTEAIGLYRQWASPRGEIESRALLSKELAFQGKLGAAHEQFSAGLELSQRQADPAGEYWSLTGLAECGLWLGMPLDEVLARLKLAQGLLAQHSFGVSDVVRGFGLLALAHLRNGESQVALTHAQTGLRWLGQLKLAGVWTIDGIAALAEACLGLGLSAEPVLRGLQHLARIFPIAGPRASWLQGRLAWAARRPAQAQRAWQQGLRLAEQFGMPYEQGLIHSEWAQQLPAGPQRDAHVQQAEVHWAQLGIASP